MSAERILVVDDEEAIREVVTSMLSSAGYQCQQAGSGKEALAVLESDNKFELMLSDLMMAELDGIALLERTKATVPMTIYSSPSNESSCWRRPGGRWKIVA